MKIKAFTLLESTVILLVTSVILGTSFYFLNINKKYQEFESSKLLLSENLRRAQDLSFKKSEIVINNTTSTICGVGVLISGINKEYLMIAYATSSPEGSVDCYKIASNTPEEFNFSNKQPNIFVLNNNEFTTDPNNQLITKLKLNVDKIEIGTSTMQTFSSTSLIFVHPYGDIIVYKDGSRIDFDKEINIGLDYQGKYATISITKAGQVILK